MKEQHILTYCTNTIIFSLLLCCHFLNAQEDKVPTVVDSIKVKQKYGIRVGVDASKLLRSFIDDEYKGFELNGDYRLTKNWYIAAEIGNEEKTTSNDFLSVTAKGSYLKAGVDYNLYDNWLGMENMIYSGFRVGTSTFSQTLNSFSVYAQDQFWQPQFTSNEVIETKGLSSVWMELQLGIKAEVLTNLFLGLNFQLKGTISEDQPANSFEDRPINYENLFIPGFNKTFDSGRIGVGYGYTISYLIPLFKKG